MLVLVMVLVGYGINDNRLRIKKMVDFMVFYSEQASSSETTGDKVSVMVRPSIPVYTLRKKWEIKTGSVETVSFLTRLPCLLVP